MDGILELAEDNIREDTAYSMKERAEIAQKDARKAEKENKDLKAVMNLMTDEQKERLVQDIRYQAVLDFRRGK